MAESARPRRSRRQRIRRFLRLLAFGIGSALLIGCLGFNGMWVFAITRPAQHDVCCITPAEWGATYEDVMVPGADGVQLAGWYIPTQNGAAVLVLHGYGADRLLMWPHIRFLSEAGYGVLALDLRAHGASGGDHRSWGWLDAADMHHAIDFLLEQPGVEHVGILGHSIGGQAALRTAARHPAVEAVVADGPSLARAEDIPFDFYPETLLWYLTFDIQNRMMALYLNAPLAESVSDALDQLAGRDVLIIAAGGNPPEARTAQRYYDRAAPPKDLWIVPGVGHGQTWVEYPDEYAARVLAFFDAAWQDQAE